MTGWWKKEGRGEFGQGLLRETPSLAEAVILLGWVMVLFLLVSYLIMNITVLNRAVESRSRFAAVLVIELLGVGLPVAAFLRLRGFAPAPTLGLAPSGWANLTGAALMGVGMVFVAPQLEAWQASLITPPEEHLEALVEFVTLEAEESLLWALVCLAVVPAVCEEALFRGVLLKACIARWHKASIVVVIGVLFGLFHLDLWRWPLLSLIGMLLTWTAMEAASIWPAVVFHLVSNSASLLLVNLNWPAERDWTVAAADVPPGLFVLGAGLLVVGSGLVRRNRRRRSRKDETIGRVN